MNKDTQVLINKFLAPTLFAVAICFGQLSAHDEVPGAKQKQPIALVGGTIHPISAKPIEGGVILFHKGKIVDIGKDLKIPKSAKVIDIKGKHVYPSLFEAHSQIGLIEIGAVRATDDRSEVGTLNPNVKSVVAVNPDSEIIPVTRSNGVLLALTAPSGFMVSGKSSVIQLDGWTYEDMTVKTDVAMNVVWPSAASAIKHSAPATGRGRFGGSTSESLTELRKLFDDARIYQKSVADSSVVVKHDLRLESMIQVLDRKVPLMIEANDLQQIQSAVAFCVEQNVRMILFGGYDAPYCAELLKKHDIPVVLSAVYRTPSRRQENYDAAYTLPARLQKLGVTYCISGSDRSETWNTRILPDHAGTAVAYGLAPEEALKAITIYPAQILGVSKQVGSLEKGKDATLFVSTKSPLDITNQVEMAWIQGRTVELNDRHKRLYKKYDEKYRRQKQ